MSQPWGRGGFALKKTGRQVFLTKVFLREEDAEIFNVNF